MLKDAGPLTDKQQEYLVILMECSQQLMNMMNNILDFSKITSGRLVLLRESMDISKAINTSVFMVEGKARAKNIELKVDVPKHLPIVLGDLQRLTQIISNLLSNAVKFTDKGGVYLRVKIDTVRAAYHEDEYEYIKKWKVTFEVEDTGIGVRDEDKNKIFDMFHQSSSLDTSKLKNGTGLGLSISKGLVEMMGGTLEVFSPGTNKGSIFKFSIIVEEEIRLNDIKTKHAELIKGSKIMVIDDRSEYRIQLTEFLLKWGANPTVVGSGEEALQYIRHKHYFDVIIVDICMPYMSGTEFAQNLKQIETNEQRLHTPLIALSSIDLPQGGVELFNIYMNKPIDQNSLFPAILECLCSIREKPSQIINGTHKQESPRLKKLKKNLKILIAEDDHNNAYTIKEMLGHLGYSHANMVLVENGEKAVDEAKKNRYDVILMDIVMPLMDGIEATRHIRVMANRPYIIAISAAVQNTDKQKCQQVGIDGYVSKPVIKEKLDAALYPLVLQDK